jgi:ankyrin repeat protein
VVDRAGRSELHYCAISGDGDRARELIREGAAVDLQDRAGFAPLHVAAQAWSVAVARALLEAGASVDIRNAYGNTPLWVAVFSSRGRGELIELLRAAGASPLALNASGQTPLALARLIANYDVRRFFEDLP